MRNSLCSKGPRLRRHSKAILTAVALAALFALPTVSPAAVPDWLRAAANATLPTYSDETSAAVVFDETITTIKDNGDIESIYRRAIRILRPEGEKYATVAVDFDTETRLTYLKGWSISARGDEYEMKEKDAIETSLLSLSLYSDVRHKVMHLPAAEVGAVLGYEYVQKQRPRILQSTWIFQRTIPVMRARYALQLPSGWELDSMWLNHEEVKPLNSGANEWVWELENLNAIEVEPSMPAWRSVAGRLALTFFPGGKKVAGQSHGSWREVGQWYASLAADRREPTPEILTKTRELIASGADTLGKIQALTRYVQRDIRYVAIEIGIGGFQPHYAGEVLSNLYGDCKDKATLLGTMLREAGIESFYVLIHSERGFVAPEYPTALTFNHAILAIRLPQDVDPANLYTVIRHPKFGNLLFFDPTDPETPLGYLPSTLQENHGLLVLAEGGELVQLPLLPPALNRLLRSASFTLAPDGSIVGGIQEIRWGDHAFRLRHTLTKAVASDRAKILENYLGQFLGGIAFQGAEVEGLEDSSKPLVVRYRFVARNYAKSAGHLLLVRPRVVGRKATGLLEGEERKHPVEFDSASLETDMFDIILPAGYEVDEIPEPVAVDCGFLDYKSTVKTEGNVLKYMRNYSVKGVYVPRDKLAELKTFYRQVAGDERNNAVLKRLAP